MRWKMLFKIGLTIIIFVAVYLYYSLNQQKSSTENQPEHLVGDGHDQLHQNDQLKNNEVDLEAVKEKERIERWQKSIHLSVVACGDRGNETIILLKSAVLFTSSYFIAHIFAESELQENMKAQLDFWPEEYKSRMEYRIYDISFPGTKNAEEWKKLFKPCASQRLFLPSLLKDVDSLIYVDTDILFLTPLDDLWSFFVKFNNTQLAAVAPEHEDKATGWYNRFARHPYYGELGVNSGVMLMNLTRLRHTTWLSSMIDYHREYKLKITWGDQDLINIYFHYHPDQLYVFNCEWNFRPDHCMYMSVCRGADRDGAYVLHGSRRVMHNDKQPAFKAVYDAFKNHEFSSTIKYHLIENIKRNMKKVADTNCGRVGHIFVKQIEQFVKKVDDTEQKKINPR
ncbi:hypothetical protein FSP39_010364 [Pinctada imbricata]|uniref:UDP-D-xylose:beta-D-glucoside alpha-1,3-D-xylosyltransferase n=1 Tax=Pinctada imbricata TaxID=66713 RepID=A0AA88YM23_PINIB|nr:hypothetical protein FSP39_010364 [Pinctada imbricata]